MSFNMLKIVEDELEELVAKGILTKDKYVINLDNQHFC